MMLLAAAVFHPVAGFAQDECAANLRHTLVLRWWPGAAFVDGLSVLMPLDQPLQHLIQDNRSRGSDRTEL
jgi:hypothetical protein